MRMTRRVKPPTAAVTMTNTWPWSEAISDAEGGGKMEDCWEEGKRCGEKIWKRRQRRRKTSGWREKGECKEQVWMIKAVGREKKEISLEAEERAHFHSTSSSIFLSIRAPYI